MTAARLVVERELEGGLVEVLRIGLPALLTIQTGINEPRYANLRAIKQAREKPLRHESPASLGLDRGRSRRRSPVRRRRTLASPAGAAAARRCSSGSTEEIAARIAELVRERSS